MHQHFFTPDLVHLKEHLEGQWEEKIAALRDSGVPVMLEGDDKTGADAGDKTGDDKTGDGDDGGKTGEDDDKAGDDKTGDDDDDDGVEYVRIPKAEHEENQRKARQQAARAKKAENDAKIQREREAAEQGRFQELAEGYKTERDEAIRDRDEARREYTDLTRRIDVERIAKRLNFVDQEDAWIHIQRANLADAAWADKAAVEKALKVILREKPHLAGTGRPTGASRRGGGNTLTIEEVGRMSPEEINKRWDEVQAAMAASAG